MGVVGIICEYDPFHNGHAAHMRLAKEASGAEAVVCVMSCAFTQRGEAALFSTRTRAHMALACGADIVFGLPYSSSVREAENFALGGISILKSISEVSHVAFGCEQIDIGTLSRIAEQMETPSELYQSILRERLAQGVPFAAAQGCAISKTGNIPMSIIKRPNTILAICYLRALRRLRASMKPVVVPRVGDHGSEAMGDLASASAVRAAVSRGDWYNIRSAMPEASFSLLQDAVFRGEVQKPGALDAALIAKLLSLLPETLKESPDISEGLERRILAASRTACSRETLIDLVKTKRYTRARISRVLCHILTGATQLNLQGLPQYVRLLGFRRSAIPLLSRMANSGFPIISKPAGDSRLALDMRAEQLWALGAGMPPDTYYRQKMLIL